MARVARLAGAIIAETGGRFYLVGHTKRPCRFQDAGFEPPERAGSGAHETKPGFICLARLAATELALDPPTLTLAVEGEALPRLLASLFLVERTGSISERLWRLATGAGDQDDVAMPATIDAHWLGAMPPPIWQIVRDSVLRCS